MNYVGLDVHKHVIVACVMDACGECIHRQKFACTREAIETFAREHLRPDDQVALEATTNTWAVVDILRPFVGKIVVGNPLRTKAIAEAKVKTDKVDATVLAQLLRCDYLPSVWEPDERTRQLRKLTTAYASLTGDRTRLKNRIRSILAQALIEPPMKVLFTKAGITWLKNANLPGDDRLLVDELLRLLEAVELEMKHLDERLRELSQDRSQVKLLMTLPGVSYRTALTLLGAWGDISRFRDGDHAAGYVGLEPSTRQSAAHCYHGSITKAGNSHARWMLTQGVQHLATQSGPLGVFFRRLARRKSRNVAITAAARKLVTIAYLMLKNNEPYRYADPKRLREKFNILGRHASAIRPRISRAKRSLVDVCVAESLPPPKVYSELPDGEKKMLHTTGTVASCPGVVPREL